MPYPSEESSLLGTVFNIQRFTVHDGPGIRTEVFLKGCPLRCKWCSNPESFSARPELGVYTVKCLGTKVCGFCVKACPKKQPPALRFADDKLVGIDRDVCDGCMRCHDECPADAIKMWGKEMSVEEVMKVVLADRNFYDRSGGGVTLSGGESLMQHEFARAILARCSEEYVHTCVESALHVPTDIIEGVANHTDMFITDIKHMDNAVHERYTGVGNALIHKNIARLAEIGKPMILRLPIIPDVNDSAGHVDAVSDFILENLGPAVVQVQFLRFRRLGEEKYQSLGLSYRMEEINPERKDFEAHIRGLVERMAARGIPAVAGTHTKIKNMRVVS